ncbi:MAG: hypothetical protein VXZ18_19390, partial [Pseudomonadota bacterium]|nr:hypothetical protein [Pseudomonadota bacterium]
VLDHVQVQHARGSSAFPSFCECGCGTFRRDEWLVIGEAEVGPSVPYDEHSFPLVVVVVVVVVVIVVSAVALV